MDHADPSAVAPRRPDLRAARGAAILLLAAALWGAGNLANKTILADVSPVAALVLRNLVACVALAPAIRAEVPLLRARGWLTSALPVAGLFAAGLFAQQWAYQQASVTNASFLVNTASVMTPVLGYLMWRERLSRRILLAAILVLAGAFLMSGTDLRFGRVNPGDAICLVSAFFYALWTLALGQHLARHPTPMATTFLQCLVTLLASLPLLAAQDLRQDWLGALPEALFLGIFATALAFALMASAQVHVTASTAAVIVAAESVFGGAAGVLVLGERPEPPALLGAGLILASVAVAALRPELRPPAPLLLHPSLRKGAVGRASAEAGPAAEGGSGSGSAGSGGPGKRAFGAGPR